MRLNFCSNPNPCYFKNFSWYIESSVVAWKNELLNIVICNRNRCGTSCLRSFRSSFKTLSIKDRAYNVSSNNTDLTNQTVCKLEKWKYLVLRKRFFNKFALYWHHFGHASSWATKFGKGRTQLHGNLLTSKYFPWFILEVLRP